MEKKRKRVIEVVELDLPPISRDELTDIRGGLNEGCRPPEGCSRDCPSYPPES